VTERDNLYDCIRALAAVIVIAVHCGLMRGGAIGVNIFFVLSGFFITNMLMTMRVVSATNIAKFIFQRFMRVWPLMAIQVFVALSMLALFKPERVAGHVSMMPGMLTFTLIPAIPGISSDILWSLPPEFWFYILYAVTFYFTGRRAVPWIAATGIVVSWVTKYFFGHAHQGIFGSSLPMGMDPILYTFLYMDHFMFGVLCAWLIDQNNATIKHLYSNRILSLWLPLAGIVGLAMIPVKSYGLQWYIQSGAAAFLTAALILHQWANPIVGGLEPMATLGRISYSTYLFHAVVLDLPIWRDVPRLLMFLAVCAITVAISLFTYRWIERPFIRLSKRLAHFESSGPDRNVDVKPESDRSVVQLAGAPALASLYRAGD
jgi:peptidoglycan/LPS O-acetylase OafA/YrhL